MSLTGNWNVTMKSPIGEQKASLAFVEDGPSLTGTLSSGSDATPIQDGSVDGASAKWNVKVTKPMPITLGFSGTVAGDTITGEVKFGGFGAGPFTATRA